jgi:hypothetical protein
MASVTLCDDGVQHRPASTRPGSDWRVTTRHSFPEHSSPFPDEFGRRMTSETYHSIMWRMWLTRGNIEHKSCGQFSILDAWVNKGWLCDFSSKYADAHSAKGYRPTTDTISHKPGIRWWMKGISNITTNMWGAVDDGFFHAMQAESRCFEIRMFSGWSPDFWQEDCVCASDRRPWLISFWRFVNSQELTGAPRDNPWEI